jgi:hypothetical protein
MALSNKDRITLRNLAAEQMRLAQSPQNKALLARWEAFGRLEGLTPPLLRMEMGTFQADILPPLMRCEGDEAREIEQRLLSNFVNQKFLGDDTLVQDYFSVSTHCRFTPFNLPVRVSHAAVKGKESLGHHFEPHLCDLEEDYEKLSASTFEIDTQRTQAEVDFLGELFGDILPVKKENPCLYACPTQDIIHIMRMEDMYIAMIDAPELFHQMMERLTDDYCRYFRAQEEMGILNATTKSQHLNQGSYCFTADLPDKKENVKTKDIWGFMDSQETTAISPAMFKEFIFPYYKKISDLFGLLSYGCCEAVHPIWTGVLETLPMLRKVSISPWCDERFMGDALRGKKIVYLRKPTPNLIGLGSVLDEAAIKAHFRDTLLATRGCHVEFAQRDVYSVGSAERVKKYVQLFRETVDQYWQA